MNEEIVSLIKPLAKTATKLNLRKVRKTDDLLITGTYFGGQPYAEKGEEYPICPSCRKPPAFICQIDMTNGFHEKPEDISLFTFFYCWECFPWGLNDEEKGQWVVRIYNEPKAEKFSLIQPSGKIENSTQPCTVSVERILSFPSWDEIDYEIHETFKNKQIFNSKEPWSEYETAVQELGGFDDYATVIGGYVKWLQGEEILMCEICKQEMELLAQIDSEEKAGIFWGDTGLIYLFFCKNHLIEKKLILQCL